MKFSLACVLFLSTCLAQTAAPSPGKQKVLWQKLESSIQEIDQHLDGVMGIAIEDLTTGDHYYLHEDEVFAQASSIKITVLADLYLQAQQGKLKLTDLYTVQSSDLVPDSDIMGGLARLFPSSPEARQDLPSRVPSPVRRTSPTTGATPSFPSSTFFPTGQLTSSLAGLTESSITSCPTVREPVRRRQSGFRAPISAVPAMGPPDTQRA